MLGGGGGGGGGGGQRYSINSCPYKHQLTKIMSLRKRKIISLVFTIQVEKKENHTISLIVVYIKQSHLFI